MRGVTIFNDNYFKNYKKFLFIPFLILLLAIISLVVKVQTTGDFINRDITLKGGIALTILNENIRNTPELETLIANELAPDDFTIRNLDATGKQIGILIESEIQELSTDKLDSLLMIIEKQSNIEIKEGEYSLETMGSSLGKSFFDQTFRALILAFIFMGIVVFLYFRTFVPSMAVILSAFSDIIVTVAVINFMGIKLGTAGIAALLMLIGYSIDTDIMLTTRVLKRKDSTVKAAMNYAFTTGITMTLTTIAAITVALVFSQSEVIKQIMTILLIGLAIDIMNTWVQNAGLLVWYTEWKK